MSNSDTLTMGELEEAAQVATSALGFPLEVMNTGGGIWLAIGRVPADTTVEVVIGDGDTDTKYGWSVNRTDERGDHMDTLAEGVTNALPEAFPPIREAIRRATEPMAPNGLPVSLWERPVPTDRPTAEAWVADASIAFGGGYHPDDLATGYVQRGGIPTFTVVQAAHFQRRNNAAYDILASDGGPDAYSVGLRALKTVAGFTDIDLV